ncbi:MAG: DUF2752 domain-containing protein [Actinobacteria bacterium]|nr:DUF2752 domain-containing protein [Actinomycetota bacterium]
MTELVDHGDHTHVGDGATGPNESAWSKGTFAGRSAVLVVGIGVGLVGVHAVGIPTPPCPLRAATGFPCPLCGMTHVARGVLTGNVALVARHDPAGLALALFAGVAVAAQLWAMARGESGPGFMTSRATWIVVAAVLAAHWVTTIFTGGMLVT